MDLSEVPILALSVQTRTIISTLLNPIKTLCTNNKLPRDWRGLIYIFKMSNGLMSLLSTLKNPFNQIFEIRKNTITLKDLQNAFKETDRWDVFDDTKDILEKDAQVYVEKIKSSETFEEDIDNNDSEVLTIDDLYISRKGTIKEYDAFLLYADEDFDFAMKMLKRLEAANLKICTKDRDLVVGGGLLENEIITKLLSKRCHRLLVIITPDFLKNPFNVYFLDYARAMGIDRNRRKLIACIYKDCEELPESLSHTLNVYYRSRIYYDMWGQIIKSVKRVPLGEDDMKINWHNKYVPIQQYYKARKRRKRLSRWKNTLLSFLPSELIGHSSSGKSFTNQKVKKIDSPKFLVGKKNN